MRPFIFMGLFNFWKKEEKANPPRVMFADESSRGTISKVLTPNYLFRPPFGVPRFKDVFELRRLGNTPQARIAKQVIIDGVKNIEWAIVPSDDSLKEIPDKIQNEIDEVTNFFMNPNTLEQSWEYIEGQLLEDVLDLDSGILVKEFDSLQRMVEIRAADGATFLKNPDIHGKFINRDEIISQGGVNVDIVNGLLIPNQQLTISDARLRAAYFQFGFLTSARPIPFGKREIVWLEKNPQTNQMYGKSPVETIDEILQSLIYAIEYNLDYFEDNNVPKGFINMPGANDEELEAFRDKWNDLQLVKNRQGRIRKAFHRVPMTNTDNADFIKVQFTPEELQLIAMQTWFTKIVFSAYGVTPSEAGFTEDSNLATEINQSKVNKRKALLPYLKLLETYVNKQVLPEWDFHADIKFQYNTFDIDDEKSKQELFNMQIESGYKKINEIRLDEGLEELEEEEPEEVSQELLDQMNSQENNGQDPKQDESIERAEKKAKSPEQILQNALLEHINSRRKEVVKALRIEAKKDRLTNIKSFKDILDAIGRIFNFSDLKGLIDRVTEKIFKDAVSDVDKLINLQPIEANQEQIKFLSEMTFDNIKGMEADLENKLKQAIRMSITNGEGITQMAERVSKAFDVGETRARAIAITESNRIENMGALQGAKSEAALNGVKMKKYLLWTLDSRTSELTKALHRKYGTREKAIPLDDNFKITFGGKSFDQAAPPFHVNERDALITFVVEE